MGKSVVLYFANIGPVPFSVPLHDEFRMAQGGKSTFDQVYQTARLLRQYEIPFNPLTVVNRVNTRHPDEVYQFLTEDLGCTRLQWLPCVAPKDFRTTAPAGAPIALLSGCRQARETINGAITDIRGSSAEGRPEGPESLSPVQRAGWAGEPFGAYRESHAA